MSGETDAIVEKEPGDDLHSLLNAAFDKVSEEVEPVRETRQRGPDGKFVKPESDSESDSADTESVSAPEPHKDAEEPKAPAEAKTAGVEPPPTWKPEDREAFKALPPAAQQILLKRHGEMEADYSHKTQAIAALRRDYEPVAQILSPHMDRIKASGFTPASLIEAWHNAELNLANPAKAAFLIRDLVTNYKIDRAQIARELGFTVPTGAPGTTQPPAPVDGAAPIQIPPEVASTIQSLAQRQQQFDQYLAAQQQSQRIEAQNRVMSTIEAFKDAKDDKGELKHPHYDELETEMISLLAAARASGREPGLDELYEKAVWANTSTREKVLSGQRAAEEAQRKAEQDKVAKEARAKAERARKAGSSVTGAPSSGQTASSRVRNGTGTLRDELESAFEDVSDAA